MTILRIIIMHDGLLSMHHNIMHCLPCASLNVSKSYHRHKEWGLQFYHRPLQQVWEPRFPKWLRLACNQRKYSLMYAFLILVILTKSGMSSRVCIPSILQYVGHVSLEVANAVWDQYVVLSQVVQLGGEHKSCKCVEFEDKV